MPQKLDISDYKIKYVSGINYTEDLTKNTNLISESVDKIAMYLCIYAPFLLSGGCGGGGRRNQSKVSFLDPQLGQVSKLAPILARPDIQIYPNIHTRQLGARYKRPPDANPAKLVPEPQEAELPQSSIKGNIMVTLSNLCPSLKKPSCPGAP